MKSDVVFTGHTKDVLAVSISVDNRMIISGGMDKTMRFWNLKGENKYTSTNFNSWVSSMCHVRQDKDSQIAVGSWDSKVRIFDHELNYNRSIDALEYAVVSMTSDDDGEYLFVGQKNGSVKIYNLAANQNESDTLKQEFDIHADLNALSYESKFFTVISLATSKGISVRDIKGEVELYDRSYTTKGTKEGKVNYYACNCLAWDPTKTYLFAGFTDGIIRVYKFTYEN